MGSRWSKLILLAIKISSSKLEIRNSKQFPMIKKQKLPNKPVSDFVIGI
jgi:hypothetical protein